MELAGRTLLGKYRIEGLLGQGGMGTVWRGSHVVTGRKVAIKVLDERFLSNVNIVQRFGREARAASAIHHEGIVEVLDLDQTEEGLPFLVMEFLEGETVASRIERRKRIPQDEVVRIGTMLLEALEAAHQHGVVHRDLKPDNIYLVPAGRRGEIVKILDFGISHKDDEAQAKLTMTGSVLGTPHYMSPEQAMGETTLDKRVDVYGAGVVLYECLVGDVPFDAPNYNKLLRVILDENAVPPSQRGALVDPRVEQVVLRALEKDRDRRWQSAREALDALRAATRRTPAAGMEAQERARRSATSATFARPSGVGTPTPQPRERRPSSSVLELEIAGALPPLSLDVPPPVDPRPARAAADRLPTLQLDAARLDPPSAALRAERRAEPVAAPPVLELDETALAQRTRSSSGQIRAVTGGVATTGAHRAVSERAVSERAMSERAVSERAMSERAVSERALPRASVAEGAPRTSSVPAPAAAGAEDAAAAPARAAGLGERWAALPEGTRRAITLGSVGLLLFVAVVTGVRLLVRPGEDEAGAVASAPRQVADEAGVAGPSAPDWVLIEVDGVPPGARLWLDGLPGASVPLRVRRGGEHVLEIRAAGYEDRRIEFRARANQRLRADMRPAIGTTQQLR